MGYHKTLFTSGLLTVALMVTGSPVMATERSITRAERAELHHDRREYRGDLKDSLKN